MAAFACAFAACIVPEATAQTPPGTLLMPSALAYDAEGDLYIADARRNQVLEATAGGKLVVVAGTGTQGFSGDQGDATAAQLNQPQGLVFGADGTLYIADTGNARIRAVTNGIIFTFAGVGSPGSGGDGGPATQASFRSPTALAVSASGDVLVCDTEDQRVRRISGGVVSTFAGDGVQGFGGDGGAAAQAELDSPASLAIEANGAILIADAHNNRIRVVSADGSIGTFAGDGTRGFAGDGGAAGGAELAGPRGLTVASDGSVLIADAGNERIRRVSAAGGITTIAGQGAEGTSVDGQVALQAMLHAPRVLALGPFGRAAIGDVLNGAVRVMTPTGLLYEPAAFAAGRTTALQAGWTEAQVYGQTMGSMTARGTVGVPQGEVSLSEQGQVLANVALQGGMASFMLASLSAGVHSVTLTYSGDGLNPATSDVGILTVNPAPVTAVADPVSVSYGAPLPVLSGRLDGVLPQDAGQVSVVFNANTSSLSDVGDYPITAALTGPKSGDYALTPQPASGTLEITRASSQVILAGVPQSYVGLPLRLSASVSPAIAGQPSGTVQFLDGGTVVGNAAVTNGAASAVYLAPPAGVRSLSARYSGDANFAPSVSALQQVAVSEMPDFAISASVGTASIAAGGVATYTVQVSSQGEPFTGVVVLSAAGLPAGAKATFSPVQVVPGEQTAVVSITVQTPVLESLSRSGAGMFTGAAFASLGVLFLGCARGRRRLAWLAGASLLMSGCGARTVSEGSGGITSQSYALQVTGTSTNLLGIVVTHSVPLTLIVQQ